MENNPFQWEEVWMDLPWTVGYNCLVPQDILLRKDGKIAVRKFVFIDDTHLAGQGKDKDIASEAQRVLACRMIYYGNQEAAHKHRHASLVPGTWNGSIIHCNQPVPVKSTTAKKWKHSLSCGRHLGYRVIAKIQLIISRI